MKRRIFFTSVILILLFFLSSFSFSGGPYNIAAGKYVLVPVNPANPVYPFYDVAEEEKVCELLYLSTDGLWTLLIKCENTALNADADLILGRYLIADDSLIFVDDTNCCSFSGKLKGDGLIVKTDGAKDNFTFVRINSNR